MRFFAFVKISLLIFRIYNRRAKSLIIMQNAFEDKEMNP